MQDPLESSAQLIMPQIPAQGSQLIMPQIPAQGSQLIMPQAPAQGSQLIMPQAPAQSIMPQGTTQDANAINKALAEKAAGIVVLTTGQPRGTAEDKALADKFAAHDAERAAAEKAQFMGTAQGITQGANETNKTTFAASFSVCPPGMTDTRDGYCQPPIIPFLKSSGAMSGGDSSGSSGAGDTSASGASGASGAAAAPSAPRIPYIGICPPDTTPVPDQGCLPAKILSWAPGAILIPYLFDLSTSLNNINTSIKTTSKTTNPIAVAINNAAKMSETANAITNGITTLSTSIDTINSSLQAGRPGTSYGGRRTRKKRARRNRKTKNIAK